MNWTLFISTFVTIFVAEMGDKTQLAALAASASSKSTWTIFFAAVTALSLASLIGVFLGKLVGDLLNPQILKILSGVLFIVMGGWILLKN